MMGRVSARRHNDNGADKPLAGRSETWLAASGPSKPPQPTAGTQGPWASEIAALPQTSFWRVGALALCPLGPIVRAESSAAHFSGTLQRHTSAAHFSGTLPSAAQSVAHSATPLTPINYPSNPVEQIRCPREATGEARHGGPRNTDHGSNGQGHSAPAGAGSHDCARDPNDRGCWIFAQSSTSTRRRLAVTFKTRQGVASLESRVWRREHH
ncbi:hypothetical protein BGZ61DRAFT_577009 [Ilyonectria robusta]|uniref:uncharacterized protein n=1 Tax=Ilyonectria robusta TaxID=1079257 RepID=UPI001E8E37AA|nr:uncharacterized protein BGZ61DRAFT_577009 [Ilyonectria robusta]KAH8699598.1 hypothetical protein BGZ61DRAFT_577009 [Ilyonectria robusta]